ncbi:hypothetical protein M9458_054596 [Cirrhinus mrigala]|uniref:Uncharacterized protein n=1 Tax=Cirrhinus mrigala TaxID=683832 RepID=A0ABD0MJY5_CIRMR
MGPDIQKFLKTLWGKTNFSQRLKPFSITQCNCTAVGEPVALSCTSLRHDSTSSLRDSSLRSTIKLTVIKPLQRIKNGSPSAVFAASCRFQRLQLLRSPTVRLIIQHISTRVVSNATPSLSLVQVTDGHGESFSCLGAAHTKAALTKTECPHCEDKSLASLRSRIAFFSDRDSAPRAVPLSSS